MYAILYDWAGPSPLEHTVCTNSLILHHFKPLCLVTQLRRSIYNSIVEKWKPHSSSSIDRARATRMPRSCQCWINIARSTICSCSVCRCLAFCFYLQVNILVPADDDASFAALTSSHSISWISRFPLLPSLVHSQTILHC